MVAPKLGFNQGFSQNTADFQPFIGASTITPVASGTNGIVAPDGDGFYAVVTDPSATPNAATGPYTQNGGYSSEFVNNSETDVRVYLNKD